MPSAMLLLLAALTTLSAQVKFNPADQSITIDGKPFTTFHKGDDAGKPFLSPLRSASGKVVTRLFPMESIPGESRDHLHHRGLWFTYDDINGVKFWENDPSYKKGRIGRVVVRDSSWKGNTLTATMEWRDPEGKVLLVETRDTIFRADPALRVIDFRITLTAAVDVTFGDTKEGAFAIRLAENFTEKRGGKISDSEGRAGMANVWGKRSKWVDYSGEIDGEKLGVAIFDHPANPHHPTYWHARNYGLFSLNPFGQNSFDPSAPENIVKLKTGEKIAFHWRVVIHPGDAETGKLADLYKEFATSK